MQCYCIQLCNIKVSLPFSKPQQQEGMQNHKICLYVTTSKNKSCTQKFISSDKQTVHVAHTWANAAVTSVVLSQTSAVLLCLAVLIVHEYGNFRHIKNLTYLRVYNVKPSYKVRGHLYAKSDFVFLHILNSGLICFMFGQLRQPMQFKLNPLLKEKMIGELPCHNF
jgi:hypothetical protein